MSISSLLNLGTKGLTVGQAGVRATSQNITNINTPGYRVQGINVLASDPYSQWGVWQPNGADVKGYQHTVNRALDNSLRNATSDSTEAGVRSGVLKRAEAVFTDMKGSGLTTSLDGLFSAFEKFAAAPQDDISRSSVLNSAEQLVQDFNGYASDLTALRQEVNGQVDSTVKEINTLTSKISSLNNLITDTGADVSLDLVDRRDQLLKELSGKVEVTVISHDNGAADVSLKGSGVPLVISDTQYELKTGTNAAGDKSVIGTRHGGDTDVTASLRGGKLGGLIKARDVDLAEVTEQLDEMAFQFATAVNDVHAGGVDKDGNTGLPMFTNLPEPTDTPPAPAGAAGMLTLNTELQGHPERLAGAATGGGPGDNTNANLLAGLADKPMVADGKTPGEALRGVLTAYGEASSRAANQATTTAQATAHIEQTWQSQSGVSLDEEMANLMKYQASYQAAARVITTADSLLQETLALKR